MKIRITPTQLDLRRRYFLIKETLDEVMGRVSEVYLNSTLGFENFLHLVSNMTSEYIVDKEGGSSNPDMVTLRNQIKQFIKTHFREEIKEYFLKSIS